MNRWLAGLLSVCVFASCAAEEAANNGTNGTTGATTGSNNSTTDAGFVDCAAGLFAQTVPYASGGQLPFSFDIPARFGNIDESSPQQVSGTTFDVTAGSAGDFVLAYTVVREPVGDSEAQAATWEGSGHAETGLDYGGTPLQAWMKEGDDVDVVRFFVPVAGNRHQASLQWTSPAGCAAERLAIRELALGSLAPYAATTFP